MKEGGLLLLITFQSFLSQLGNTSQSIFFLGWLRGRMGLSDAANGVIQAAYSVSYLLAALCLNRRVLRRAGRLRASVAGSVVTGATVLAFNCVFLVRAPLLFFWLSVGFTALAGAAASLIYEAQLALIGSLFRGASREALGHAFAVYGVAQLLSIALNMVFYIGLAPPQVVLVSSFPAGAANIAMLALHCCFRPGQGEAPSPDHEQHELEPSASASSLLEDCQLLLRSRAALFAVLMFSLSNVVSSAFFPALQFFEIKASATPHPLNLSVLFAVLVGPLALSNLLLLAWPAKSGRAIWVLLLASTFVSSGGLLLASYLQLRPLPALLYAGTAVFTFTQNVIMLVAIPGSLVALQQQHPHLPSEALNSRNANLFTLSSCFSMMVGALLGNALEDGIGFPLTCLVLGAICFVATTLFQILNRACPQKPTRPSLAEKRNDERDSLLSNEDP